MAPLAFFLAFFSGAAEDNDDDEEEENNPPPDEGKKKRASLRTAVDVPRGVIREGASNPFRRFRLRACGGRSLLPPRFRWGVFFFFLFIAVVS